MKKYFYLMLVILSMLIGQNAFAQLHQTTKVVLDNGMPVVITEMPSSPLVSVYALVKTGSATEAEYLGSGISHFLEHMVFKGTEKYKAGEIPSIIQAVGGYINASTGLDYTIYTITVPSDAFDVALEILSEMIQHANMGEEGVEKEREVIHGEMRLYIDNPEREINRLSFENIYIRHPYRHPIIGYRNLFDQISRDDIVNYYKSRYSPSNIVFSVAGNVQVNVILPKIKETFKDFNRAQELLRNLPQEPQQISSRRFDERYPTNISRLSIAFPSVSILDQDLFALDVLADILGSGESSRLYTQIYKNKKLVYSISASNYTPVDRGAFEINCTLEEGAIDKVIGEALSVIEKVKQKSVTQSELDKAKRRVLSSHIFNQQTSSTVAYTQAYDEAFTGDYQFSRNYVDAVKLVTQEDIQRVARKYLNESSMTVVALKPQKDDGEPVAEKKKAGLGEIKKFTFDNGLRVLLREDKNFPTISVRLALNGGLLEESEEKQGLTNITAELWSKGSKKYNAKKIAQVNEALSLGFGSFSGKNSFGLMMNFLSDDLNAALDLLEDAVKNPSFDEEELADLKERTIVSIKSQNDNISNFTGLELKKSLFHSHPYGFNELGTEKSVESIERKDVVNYYGRLAGPENMVIALYGDINAGTLLEELEKRFGKLKNEPVVYKANKVEMIDKPVELTRNLDKEQAMVMVGFQGAGLKSPDRYALELTASILGSSFSGRLFGKIREELGQAYTLGGASVPGKDTGYIYFYVLTSPDKAQAVKEFLVNEIKLLVNDGVTPQELKNMASYLKGRHKADIETSFSLAFMTSLDELYGIGYSDYKEYDRYIDRVTAGDIKRLALKYLNLDKAVVIVTIPNNPEEHE